MIEFIARAFALRLAVSALLLRSSNPFAPTKNEDDFGSSFLFYVCLTLQSRGRDTRKRGTPEKGGAKHKVSLI